MTESGELTPILPAYRMSGAGETCRFGLLPPAAAHHVRSPAETARGCSLRTGRLLPTVDYPAGRCEVTTFAKRGDFQWVFGKACAAYRPQRQRVADADCWAPRHQT
jgi:hypothetical protein